MHGFRPAGKSATLARNGCIITSFNTIESRSPIIAGRGINQADGLTSGIVSDKKFIILNGSGKPRTCEEQPFAAIHTPKND
jgi:hypothetical protein